LKSLETKRKKKNREIKLSGACFIIQPTFYSTFSLLFGNNKNVRNYLMNGLTAVILTLISIWISGWLDLETIVNAAETNSEISSA
jgi:hypothetical protein